MSRLVAAWVLLAGLGGVALAGPMVECRDSSGRTRITDKGCASGETQVANYSQRKRSPAPSDPSMARTAGSSEEAPQSLGEHATPEGGRQFLRGFGGAVVVLAVLAVMALAAGPRRSSA